MVDSVTTDLEGDIPPAEHNHEELLGIIQRLTDTGVWLHHPSTDETWWSEQAKKVLGIDSGVQPSFENISEKFTENDQASVKELYNEALETGDSFELDVGFTNGGTTERYLQICAAPQHTSESVVLCGTVRNVTDVKRQEQRIEVLRRTSQELREATSRQAVAEIMADTSKNILGLDNTTIRLVNNREETLQVVVATEECITTAGTRPDYSVDEATPAARTYRRGKPELHTNHSTTRDEQERGELRSGLYVPIGDHGVLSAGDVKVDAFDEQDVEAANLLGQLGAKAITRIGWTKRSRAI